MRRIAAISMLALAAAACGGGETAETIPPDVDSILTAATAAMTDVQTVHFYLERGGAPVYIFSDVEFLDAEGDYQAPDRAAAVARVAAAGITVQIGAIAISGETWTTNIITGDWEPAPENLSIDPAVLFDPEVGLPQLLRSDLTNAELIGLEEREDGERYHVRGDAPAERVEVITFGLVQDQDVVVDMWIDPVTGEVTEASFVTVYRGEEATWRLVFSEFGAEVSVPIPEELNG